jgi:hypothetical protein
MSRFALVCKAEGDMRGATIAIGFVLFLMSLFVTLVYPSYK